MFRKSPTGTRLAPASIGAARLAARTSAVMPALALALLSGCGTASLPRALSAHAPWVTVTDGQAGSTVMLRPDQELIVRLHTEPTTGYDWSLAGPPSDLLTPVGQPTFEREVMSSTADASVGDEIWRFRAHAAGNVTVRFESHRAHEVLAEPARQAVYMVRIE